MKGNNISLDAVLQRNQKQLFSVVDDEVVMLSINNNEYYCMNDVGSQIWHLLDKQLTFSELISELSQIYNETTEKIKLESKPYLLELISKGIIIVNHEKPKS